MTSQAPDATTTTTASVAQAAQASAGAAATAGPSENMHKDEVTGEMVSKR